MSGLVLWITGLPGSGKSSIADAVRKARPDFVILRMDALRIILTPEPTYSESERDLVYRSIVFTAKVIAELGNNVIIDATGNLRRWRDLARAIVPRYAEVYVRCPIETCREREASRKDRRGAPEDVYNKAKAGWPVPGISAPYEEPMQPDIVIESDHTSAEDAADLVLHLID